MNTRANMAFGELVQRETKSRDGWYRRYGPLFGYKDGKPPDDPTGLFIGSNVTRPWTQEKLDAPLRKALQRTEIPIVVKKRIKVKKKVKQRAWKKVVKRVTTMEQVNVTRTREILLHRAGPSTIEHTTEMVPVSQLVAYYADTGELVNKVTGESSSDALSRPVSSISSRPASARPATDAKTEGIPAIRQPGEEQKEEVIDTEETESEEEEAVMKPARPLTAPRMRRSAAPVTYSAFKLAQATAAMRASRPSTAVSNTGTGVRVRNTQNRRGVFVARVSAAARERGLRVGDIVTHMNGRAIKNVQDYKNIVTTTRRAQARVTRGVFKGLQIGL